MILVLVNEAPSYRWRLLRAPAGLQLEAEWWLDGTHYQRTAAAWRAQLESRRRAVMRVLRAHCGSGASAAVPA